MTSSEFLDLVTRSQLADGEQLREQLNPPLSIEQLDAEQLAAILIKAGVITQWQAHKLLAGKWKGFHLGKYTLLSHHRKTPVGQEYVAEHKVMKRKVVIAVVPPQLMDFPGYLDRFQQETGPGPRHGAGMTRYIVREYRGEE